MRQRQASPAASMLLQATVQAEDAGRWLVLGGDPQVPVGLAMRHPDGAVRWVPLDVRDHHRVRQTLAERQVTNLEIRDDPAMPLEPEETFDAVVFETTLHRPLVRRWLAHAHLGLVEGGHVFLAGANDAGVRSAVGDAKRLFRDPVSEDYRRRHRVASFQQSGDPDEDPYWFEQPGIAPGTWQSFQAEVRGHTFSLDTLPGVFPGDRLDTGTQLLLAHLTVPSGARVLDAGCGTGVIGLLAACLGAGHVDLVDANLLAVAAARANITRLSPDNVQVCASDVYDAVDGSRYDLIVSNPPFHQGKAIDLTVADRLISEAPVHLEPGGSLLIVANAFLAYGKRMNSVFREVETVAATSQYHVIRARDPR